MRVVISQPMLFPWVGLLEQLRNADVWVHYDDVQFSKGSFVNRVQIKTATGSRWLTVPLRDLHLGAAIGELRARNTEDWRGRHLAVLEQAYASAPHVADMLDLVRRVYERPTESLVEIVTASMHELAAYFDLVDKRPFLFSTALSIPGKGSERVLDVVSHLGGSVYVTGHGARNYLDHEAFEAHGIDVEYIDYQKTPYPQLHGAFTPFVSALDLVANAGRAGRDVIRSGTVPWREFVRR